MTDRIRQFAYAIMMVVCLSVPGGAHAALITLSNSFSPVLQVDSSSGTTGLTVTGSGALTVTDVNVTIDFTKCDDPIGTGGACLGTDYSYNREVVFTLTSPGGITVLPAACIRVNLAPAFGGVKARESGEVAPG